MDKEVLEKMEVVFFLGVPEEVIRLYTSEAYVRDWHAKKVAVPPMPMIEWGAHTKRFIKARVLEWMEKYFGNVRPATVDGSILPQRAQSLAGEGRGAQRERRRA